MLPCFKGWQPVITDPQSAGYQQKIAQIHQPFGETKALGETTLRKAISLIIIVSFLQVTALCHRKAAKEIVKTDTSMTSQNVIAWTYLWCPLSWKNLSKEIPIYWDINHTGRDPVTLRTSWNSSWETQWLTASCRMFYLSSGNVQLERWSDYEVTMSIRVLLQRENLHPSDIPAPSDVPGLGFASPWISLPSSPRPGSVACCLSWRVSSLGPAGP